MHMLFSHIVNVKFSIIYIYIYTYNILFIIYLFYLFYLHNIYLFIEKKNFFQMVAFNSSELIIPMIFFFYI
jgi:hypothetical protein